jgi:hypothetical protein
MPDPRTGQQLIHVITRDGTYQHLTSSALDILLEKNRLLKFRRSSGWVTVGIDPIRVKDRREASRPYQGPDKRSSF